MQTSLLKSWDAKKKSNCNYITSGSNGHLLLEFVAGFYVFPHPSDHCGTHHFTFASLMPNSITHLSNSSRISIYARSWCDCSRQDVLFWFSWCTRSMGKCISTASQILVFTSLDKPRSDTTRDHIMMIIRARGTTEIRQGLDQLAKKIHGSVHIDLIKNLCNPSKTRGMFGIFACPLAPWLHDLHFENSL